MTDVLYFTRTCTRCGIAKSADLANFPPHKMGKFGLHSQCRLCKKAYGAELRARTDQKTRQQAWRDANKDAVREANREYREQGYKSTAHVKAWVAKNKEQYDKKSREKIARYRAKDPQKFRDIAKRHYEKNKEKIIARNLHRYRYDIKYNIRSRLSNRLRKMLTKTGSKSGTRAFELFGFSRDELLAHLESRFTAGMTMEALLRGEIHIDHIRPVASFNVTGLDCDDFRQCWALSNLQPLWAKDNLKKGAKF